MEPPKEPLTHPKANDRLQLTPGQKQFIQSRTTPFIDSVGTNRPLIVLLEEAYLQGLRDAVQTMGEPDE